MKKFYLPVRAIILSALFFSHLYLYSNTKKIERATFFYTIADSKKIPANDSIIQNEKTDAAANKTEKKDISQNLSLNNQQSLTTKHQK